MRKGTGVTRFTKFIVYTQEFILELAAGDLRIINSNEEVRGKESDEYAKAAPKINSVGLRDPVVP